MLKIQLKHLELHLHYWVPEIETSDKKAGGVNAYRPESELDGPLGPE
jgi:hypothetical protein